MVAVAVSEVEPAGGDKRKRERICYLLDHWEDIWGPPSSSGGGAAVGGSTPHLSGMARHPSVVELARCLDVLKLESSLVHDSVLAYHACEWRVRVVTHSRKRKGGRTERVEQRVRARVTPGWLAMGLVRQGEFRLTELFRGPVFVPGELWDALMLSSAEIEAKRLRRGRG